MLKKALQSAPAGALALGIFSGVAGFALSCFSGHHFGGHSPAYATGFSFVIAGFVILAMTATHNISRNKKVSDAFTLCLVGLPTGGVIGALAWSLYLLFLR